MKWLWELWNYMRTCKSDKELHRRTRHFSKKFKNLYCKVRGLIIFKTLGTKRSEHLVERGIYDCKWGRRDGIFLGKNILCREFKKTWNCTPTHPPSPPAQFYLFLGLLEIVDRDTERQQNKIVVVSEQTKQCHLLFLLFLSVTAANADLPFNLHVHPLGSDLIDRFGLVWSGDSID